MELSKMASEPWNGELTKQLTVELSSITHPLTSFTLFPELPIELRLKIWKHALPMPPHRKRRMIQVFARISTTLKTRDYSRFIPQDNIHSAVLREVGMLRANWESRAVYLRRFPFSLRTWNKGLIQYGSADVIYICMSLLPFALVTRIYLFRNCWHQIRLSFVLQSINTDDYFPSKYGRPHGQ